MPDDGAPTVRAFIAVALPERHIEVLSRLVREWQSRPGNRAVRWARRDQYHLTLRFLGNVPETDLPRLITAITGATAGVSTFDLWLDGLGGFPNSDHPRVLWAGLGGALDRLGELQKRIATATAAFGDPVETRPFQAHLTLGRVYPGHRDARRLGELLAAGRLAHSDPWPVREVELVKSELRPEGAHYTVLAQAALGGAGGKTNCDG